VQKFRRLGKIKTTHLSVRRVSVAARLLAQFEHAQNWRLRAFAHRFGKVISVPWSEARHTLSGGVHLLNRIRRKAISVGPE